MPATQATPVRYCIVCYFLLLEVHESFKQENIAVPLAAHLFTEVKVLYTSNTTYYVPGKNLGRSEELQKASKTRKFLFSTLKCELSLIYTICSKTEMLSNEKNCKWSSNHHKWQQRIIKNDKWSIFIVYLENSWTYTILFSLLYPPYNCQVLLMRLHALLFLP